MSTMSTRPSKVSERYLGNPLSQSQNPGNPAAPSINVGGGRGATGGGSKPTPQANRPGSGKLGSSAPKSAQKLRG